MQNQHRIERLLSMLEQQPKDSFLLFALAKEYESSGSEDKALMHYQMLKTYEPDYIGVYYHLAALHIKLKDLSAAERIIHEGIELADRLNDRKNKAELMQLHELL